VLHCVKKQAKRAVCEDLKTIKPFTKMDVAEEGHVVWNVAAGCVFCVVWVMCVEYNAFDEKHGDLKEEVTKKAKEISSVGHAKNAFLGGVSSRRPLRVVVRYEANDVAILGRSLLAEPNVSYGLHIHIEYTLKLRSHVVKNSMFL
jgi:hypothetical protein